MTSPVLIDFPKSNFIMAPIFGDRMFPTYREGRDAVYYTRSRFIGDDVYALDIHGTGSPSILRVQNVGPDKFSVYGDNSHYAGDIFSRAELERVLLGVVVCEIRIRQRRLFDNVTGRAA